MKTTTSFIPASQNEPVPWTIAKVIYQQKSVASIARYENTGALWLMLTGAKGIICIKLQRAGGSAILKPGLAFLNG